jgi:hypothetical protein
MITKGMAASMLTGLRSFCGSNGICAYRLLLAASAPAAPTPSV